MTCWSAGSLSCRLCFSCSDSATCSARRSAKSSCIRQHPYLSCQNIHKHPVSDGHRCHNNVVISRSFWAGARQCTTKKMLDLPQFEVKFWLQWHTESPCGITGNTKCNSNWGTSSLLLKYGQGARFCWSWAPRQRCHRVHGAAGSTVLRGAFDPGRVSAGAILVAEIAPADLGCPAVILAL